MGKKIKDKKKKANKDKGKDKKGEKSKKGGRFGNLANMSTKKKVLIGAGVAAIGLAAVGGTLFVGKKIYDKNKAGKGPGGTRGLVDDGPESPALAPYHQPHPKTFTGTVDIPDAVILGLSYDDESKCDLDLLAGVYDNTGKNLGYVQGGGNLAKLFDGAIVHTGDEQAEELGDLENIIFDLRNVPSNVASIVFGAFVVTPPQAQAHAYIHMLPMIRSEQIEQQASQGATRSIEFDSDDEGEEQEFATGPRDLPADSAEADEEDFVRLFMGDIEAQGAQFFQQKAYIGGKIFRQGNNWKFTPYRLVVPADPQHGIWPAFDHYART